MQDRIYLLDLEELLVDEPDEALFLRVRSMLDAERLARAGRIRSKAAQAASIGAGLLIQKAVAERKLPIAFLQHFGVSELLEGLERADAPRQLEYRYGEYGKPYLRDIPLQFSLSHSGRFALCAVSGQEIGADIQQMRPVSNFRVAERFFASRELREIRQSGERRRQEEVFYQLWVRKEAYGKLTGEGIAAAAGQDTRELERDVFWEDCPAPEGYRIALCRYKKKDDRQTVIKTDYGMKCGDEQCPE